MGQNNPIDTSQIACVQNANLLLDEALLLIQKHYYKKDSVQWEPLIKTAKNVLNQSSDCEAAYKAVQWCFDQIKEQHSFIMPPVKAHSEAIGDPEAYSRFFWMGIGYKLKQWRLRQ
jgi:hypothetical protein